ncbi:AbrB/MazE/SpoVT family DNA-binding domain-containing protein [Candidatus Pacearchaeota archaeon]|nr:AbrB/MazE/SpoVT family DNA-binding domain-containing protein [Candidatus Pacearchaeota archaeon]
MVKITTTKISSKGQIVIPSSMRKDLRKGEELIIIKDDERFIIKKVNNLTKNIREDLEFARKTEEAWKRIEEGKGTRMNFDDFINEMKKW